MSVLHFEDVNYPNTFERFQDFDVSSMDEFLTHTQIYKDTNEDMFYASVEGDYGLGFHTEEKLFANSSDVVYGHDYSVEASITVDSDTYIFEDTYANSGFYFGAGAVEEEHQGNRDITCSTFCSISVEGNRSAKHVLAFGDLFASNCAATVQPHSKKSRYEAVADVTPLVPQEAALCLAESRFVTESPLTRDYVVFVLRDFFDNHDLSYTYCGAESTWRAVHLKDGQFCEFVVSLFVTDHKRSSASCCTHLIEAVHLYGDKTLFNQFFAAMRGSFNHESICSDVATSAEEGTSQHNPAVLPSSPEDRVLLAAQICIPQSSEEHSAQNDAVLHQRRLESVTHLCAWAADPKMVPLLCELDAVTMLLGVFQHCTTHSPLEPHLDNALIPLAVNALQNLMLANNETQRLMASDAGLLSYLRQRVVRSLSETSHGSAPVQMAVMAKQMLGTLFRSHREQVRQQLGVSSLEEMLSAHCTASGVPAAAPQPVAKESRANRKDVLSSECLLARGIAADMSRIHIGAY